MIVVTCQAVNCCLSTSRTSPSHRLLCAAATLSALARAPCARACHSAAPGRGACCTRANTAAAVRACKRLTASCCSARCELMPWCVLLYVHVNDSPSTHRYRLVQAECMCNASYDAWRVSQRCTCENAGNVPQLTQGGASLCCQLHLSETAVRCIRNEHAPRCMQARAFVVRAVHELAAFNSAIRHQAAYPCCFPHKQIKTLLRASCEGALKICNRWDCTVD